MKLQGYTHIYLCPTTGQEVTKDEFHNSSGTCSVCGHMNERLFTHAVKEVGRWEVPNFFERLKGRKSIWHPKENNEPT